MTQPQSPARARRALGMYIGLAYGIAWLVWLPLLLGADGLHVLRIAPSLAVCTSLGTAAPLIASLVAVRYESGRWRLPSRFLPPPNGRAYVNLLTGPALILLSFVLVPLWVCAEPGSRGLHAFFFLPLLRYWNILGGPTGEEFGWRGYLLPRLSDRFGPTPAAFILGIVWSTWHLPLFFVHTWGAPPYWLYVCLVTALSVIMALGFNLTGGSILAAILMHFVFNSVSRMVNIALSAASLRPAVNPQHIIFGSFFACALLLLMVTRGRLGLREETHTAAG